MHKSVCQFPKGYHLRWLCLIVILSSISALTEQMQQGFSFQQRIAQQSSGPCHHNSNFHEQILPRSMIYHQSHWSLTTGSLSFQTGYKIHTVKDLSPINVFKKTGNISNKLKPKSWPESRSYSRKPLSIYYSQQHFTLP
jgi:hypothetical protein